jgi:hypothetical protein
MWSHIPIPELNWTMDCLRWHGHILYGERRHWCWYWDFLPIDETCEEIQGCDCISVEELLKGRDNFPLPATDVSAISTP